MPDFSAASAPGHRFRCHHPVQETESTRDLVAEAATASASVSPATAMAVEDRTDRAVRDT
jgi:peptide/nickel transport system ATP-binding protein